MNSLRWKIALWFTAGLLCVLCMSTTVTYFHLRHELRVERWERETAAVRDASLHGNYSDSEINDIIGELLRLSLYYAIPLALLSLLIGYSVAARSLGPIALLRKQLDTIGPHNLRSRVSLAKADAELRAIEGNINALLTRLEQSFGQLTEFSAQVAHELRTPLTLMRLQVEENAGRIEPALAESLQDELKRLSDYVDQCLLLATAEQGRLRPNLRSLHLDAIVSELSETYELWARTENRGLVVEGDKSPSVVSDPRYLRQILHNLFANAMAHGVGVIRVAYGRTDDGTIFCSVENKVASQGGGKAGTGIGLRVSKAVADALGCLLRTSISHNVHCAVLSWKPAEPAPVRSKPD
jgi:signal transduction histidine kinase